MSSSMRTTTIITAALCVLSAGCIPSLQNNPPRDAKREMPTSFGSAGPDTPAESTAPQASSLAQKTWREFFASPELQGLIEAALANNQELNIRVQETVIAQSEVAAKRGEYLPRVEAGVGAGVEKVGEHTSQGVSDEAHDVPAILGDFKFGLRGSWEVDIWGRLRNAAKAADLRYLASVEARNFVRTQIVAEIARSYYELLALDNALEILDRNIAIQNDALEIVKLQKEAARVTELAVRKFEAEVLKNKSHRFELERQRIALENRINFLVGRYPQPVARDPKQLEAPLPEVVQSGLPSELLENRPDVRQAELELAAVKLNVDAAKAAFYPSLTIDAELGYRAFNPVHLLATPESLVFGLAGGLTAPLLNRTAIRAEYQSANAKQLQAVYQFERALLQAFTDVATELAGLDRLRRSCELQSQQVETLTHSVEVSNGLFQSARADYMEVLLTRRDSLEAQMELVETKKEQHLAMVNVYQALGGGWRTSN